MDQNLIAVIVGFVEGVTEFLPVSSTGHMIIVGHMLGFDGPAADIFDVFVQLGAILSVIFIYKERFARFFTKEGWQADKGLSVWHVAAGIVPVMGVAFFAYKYIKENFSTNIYETVKLLTHNRLEKSYEEYIATILNSGNEIAIAVKYADSLDNSVPTSSMDEKWIERCKKYKKNSEVYLDCLKETKEVNTLLKRNQTCD